MNEPDEMTHILMLGDAQNGLCARKTQRLILMWLSMNERSATASRPLRDFTRTQYGMYAMEHNVYVSGDSYPRRTNTCNHAGRAYVCAVVLADYGLLVLPEGWLTGAPIYLTPQGRVCAERYEGDVEAYMDDNAGNGKNIDISISGGHFTGNAMNFGEGGAHFSGSTAQSAARTGLEAGDLVALLGRVKMDFAMQSDQMAIERLQDEIIDVEDTPELRRSLWERITEIAAGAGAAALVEKFSEAFLGG